MRILSSLLIILSLLFVLTGCGNNNSNTTGDTGNGATFTRTSTNSNAGGNDNSTVQDNTNNNQTNNNSNDNNNSPDNKNENNTDNASDKKVIENELASFSTPLKSGVANRIVNINLTCGKINGRVLQNGETFSFNQIVGPCTAEEGYKKAEIYVNKKIQYALGGGNCQVSTTLYNAALAVPRNYSNRKT